VLRLADLNFYNKELANIQEQLIKKLDKLVGGLSTVNNTELMQIAKQIDFFDEMNKLGYQTLLAKVSSAYDDEIAAVFAELSARELSQVSAASINVLRDLKDFELTYLTNGVRQYSDQLKNAMLRGIITGESNKQIIAGLSTGFGVGTFISSSEASFLINDGLARFSNTVRAKAFEEFPEIRFKYVGTNDEKTRDVCQRALSAAGEKGLTKKQIDALGYVSFAARGGYNCRHDWIRVR